MAKHTTAENPRITLARTTATAMFPWFLLVVVVGVYPSKSVGRRLQQQILSRSAFESLYRERMKEKGGSGLDADKVGNARKKGKLTVSAQAATQQRLFGASRRVLPRYRNDNVVQVY